MLPTWLTCIVELSAVWMIGLWQVEFWEIKRLLSRVIWLQQPESKYKEPDVLVVVDKMEEELVLPSICLRIVSRSFKKIEEGAFLERVESLVAAAIT